MVRDDRVVFSRWRKLRSSLHRIMWEICHVLYCRVVYNA